MTREALLKVALAACDGDETELASRLGFKNVNSAARQFSRWRQGKGMNFDQAMALLRVAGLLRTPEEARASGPSEDEIVDGLDAATRALGQLRRRLAPPADDQELRPPARNGGG
jgi:hypothetical protein